MRIFLLRILIGWWMVPGVWLVILPLGWLMFGYWEEQVSTAKEMSQGFWNG